LDLTPRIDFVNIRVHRLVTVLPGNVTSDLLIESNDPTGKKKSK
jgi:hypothetical protein